MTRDTAILRLRKNHGPRKVRRSWPAPKLAIDKVPDAAEKKSQRYERSHKIRQLPKLHAMSANIEGHHDKHSQQTAMRTHSALPNREDLKGMSQVPRRLIKKTVAQPAAQHNAKNAPEKKVLNIVGRHAPPIILRSSTTEEPESEKTQKVHQTVPMHSQRTDRERDGIKLRMNQHAATTATFL